MQYDKLPIGDTAGTRIPADRDHSPLFSAAENGAGPGDMKEPTALPPWMTCSRWLAPGTHSCASQPSRAKNSSRPSSGQIVCDTHTRHHPCSCMPCMRGDGLPPPTSGDSPSSTLPSASGSRSAPAAGTRHRPATRPSGSEATSRRCRPGAAGTRQGIRPHRSGRRSAPSAGVANPAAAGTGAHARLRCRGLRAISVDCVKNGASASCRREGAGGSAARDLGNLMLHADILAGHA